MTPSSSLERPQAPAVWLGYQHWRDLMPPVELYVLTRDIAGHPSGSTVSRQTLEAAGFEIATIAEP